MTAIKFLIYNVVDKCGLVVAACGIKRRACFRLPVAVHQEFAPGVFYYPRHLIRVVPDGRTVQVFSLGDITVR